jgi:hypothetical protein
MQLEPDDIALDRHISTATIRKVLGRPDAACVERGRKSGILDPHELRAGNGRLARLGPSAKVWIR